jgi:hypothetical protein
MPRKPTQFHRDETEFLNKWGITAHELALVEETSVSAIHMRVMNFGTPFQRRKKPSHWEKRYNKTLGEIADELGLHPVSVMVREKTYGTPYCDEALKGQGGWNKGAKRVDHDWRDLPRHSKTSTATYFTLEDALKRLRKLKR